MPKSKHADEARYFIGWSLLKLGQHDAASAMFTEVQTKHFTSSLAPGAAFWHASLLQAKSAFDHSRGINFELFAKTRIRGAMLDEVRRISFSTRSVVSTKREHDKVISELTQALGRAPKNQEIAERLGKTTEEYERERLLAESADVVSSDTAPEYFEEVDESLRNPEQALEHSELIENLAESIEQLPERTQQILALYYQEEMNLKEIGAILDVSESRISQILSETAGKLRVLMTR